MPLGLRTKHQMSEFCLEVWIWSYQITSLNFVYSFQINEIFEKKKINEIREIFFTPFKLTRFLIKTSNEIREILFAPFKLTRFLKKKNWMKFVKFCLLLSNWRDFWKKLNQIRETFKMQNFGYFVNILNYGYFVNNFQVKLFLFSSVDNSSSTRLFKKLLKSSAP